MFKGLAAFVQALLDAVVVVLNFVAGIFPSSPFHLIEQSGFADLIAQINFLFRSMNLSALRRLGSLLWDCTMLCLRWRVGSKRLIRRFCYDLVVFGNAWQR